MGSGEASRAGGFENLNQGINIDFGAATAKVVEKKEMPTWISESTVRTAEEQEEAGQAEPDDEITNLLLRHERQKGAGGAVAGLGAGDESDRDNRSDDSDDGGMGGMQDGVDRDAALLAATFAEREDVMEDVEVMEDDSDEADDIPTIKVGGEEYEITDVTNEVIARMTTDEMERYNQLYQDFYKDMYD